MVSERFPNARHPCVILLVISFSWSGFADTTYRLPAPRLVYPRLLQERSADGNLILHIHDSLTLNLKKVAIAAPEVHVHGQENGHPVKHVYKGSDINRNLYEDEHHMATISMIHDGSSLQVEGLVGPRSRIAPLPGTERSTEGLAAHMIYEIEEKDVMDRALSIGTNGTATQIAPRYDGSWYGAPEYVIVETFFVLDSWHHHRFRTKEALLHYLCVLLNAINLRYRAMRAPMVNLMLTGLERSRSDGFWRGEGKRMYDAETLKAFKNYALGNVESFRRPDIIVLLTGRDLYSKEGSGQAATGIAYVGGLCNSFRVGIAEDDPGYYTGVHTGAHEIGHLLGATHDGNSPEPNIPGHPSARECPFSDGFLMSYVNKGAQRHFFSQCSLLQMQFIIRERGPECWQILSAGKCRSTSYPGTEISAQDICKKKFPHKPQVTAEMINPKNNECKIRCQYPKVSTHDYGANAYTHVTYYYIDIDALDLFPCGDGMVCIQGECVFA